MILIIVTTIPARFKIIPNTNSAYLSLYFPYVSLLQYWKFSKCTHFGKRRTATRFGNTHLYFSIVTGFCKMRQQIFSSLVLIWCEMQLYGAKSQNPEIYNAIVKHSTCPLSLSTISSSFPAIMFLHTPLVFFLVISSSPVFLLIQYK